jgi:lipoprotein-releasing system ATP-binding protein
MSDGPIIEVIDLHKSFALNHERIDVLRGLDMRVARGEIVAIVGASGAGKSTLLHLLGGLDRPTSGRMTVDGVQVDRLREHELEAFRNRSVGFIFQFHHLLPEFTALENVMMPGFIRGMARSEITERARRLLTDVGLAARLEHRPGELSGGEQQRVAIARALVLAPPLVLADEPTGNLDTHTGEEVMGVLKRLHQTQGTTFILVTHNDKLASEADRVMRMVDGKIEESSGP